MNISKFTQKSVQAVQDLEKIAYEFGNQEIERSICCICLLQQEDSLILKLIEKMEITRIISETFETGTERSVKVSGGELRISDSI